MPDIEFNALQYTPWELDSKGTQHPFNLVKNSSTVLRLNYHQMGLGGDNSWGARPHPEFTLYANKVYTYQFRLLPVTNVQQAMDMSKVSFSELSTVTVPNLIGSHFSVTDSVLIADGLSPGSTTRMFSATIPLDHVISQMPEAGVKVLVGTAVNLVVSSGKEGNAALNKPASASSEESSKGNTAGKANDGDISTRWCANDGGLNYWWKVDLDSIYHIVSSEVMWEFDGKTYGYTIEVSPDNVHWSTAVNKRNNINTSQTQQDGFSADARYVRMTVTQLSSGCWASFWEFKVFVSSISSVNQVEPIPKEFKLYQNYPNPFNSQTQIHYSLPQESTVTLRVFDILGRRVSTIVHNEKQIAGNYEIFYNASNLSSGAYFYNLQTEYFTEVKKLLLIK